MFRAVRPIRSGPFRPTGVLAAAMIAAVLVAASPTFAQQNGDTKSMMDRLNRLERDIQTLNYQLTRTPSTTAPAGAAPGAATAAGAPASGGDEVHQLIARMEVRLNSLESEARDATGRAEEIAHQLEQLNQRLDKLVGDVDFRLSALERAQAEMRASGQTRAAGTQPSGPTVSAAPPPPAVQAAGPGAGGPHFGTQPGVLGTITQTDMDRMKAGQAVQPTAPGAAPAQAQAQAPSAPASNPEGAAQQAAATPGVLPAGTPQEQYAHAIGLLRQTRYDDAEVAFRAFLDAHADNALAGNARYWLGETFYVRGDYVKAAEVFLDGYQKDPKGGKAPDTLLKLGMSLANLDKKQEACAAFAKVEKEYPDASTAIHRLVARERQKDSCK